MPQWLENLYDKVLIPLFGGTYDKEKTEGRGSSGNQESVAMETFRRRVSVSGVTSRAATARGFDSTHWKPHGKRRLRYHPNEYVMRCKSLAPYVKDVAYAGYLGLEERRWAGIGMEPGPLVTKPVSSVPGSLRGSRDILAKMGPGPEAK